MYLKPTTRGGKRGGAGRKRNPIPLASQTSVRIEVDLYDELRETATREDLSLSKLINLRLRAAFEASVLPTPAPPLPPREQARTTWEPRPPRPLYPITPDPDRIDEHPGFDPDRVGGD